MYAPGVLPMQDLRALIESGAIHANQEHLNPASVDLSLGSSVYHAASTALPSPGELMGCLLDRVKATPWTTDRLEIGEIYFVRLQESVEDLPAHVYGRCNPKSTSGRLDLHVRIIAEGVSKYDTIPRGYAGPLWAMVIPRSFPVLIGKGERIAQARFFGGKSFLTSEDLLLEHAKTPLLYRSGHAVHKANLKSDDGLLVLTLAMREGLVGYVAKRDVVEAVDLSKRNHYNPENFFDPVFSNGHQITLEKDRFYIFCTAETIHVPPMFAAELKSIESDFFEGRVHYAGFVDSDFRAPIVLEVRGFENVDIFAGQAIARTHFERMLAQPEELYGVAANYAKQDGPRLAKQFRMEE